MLVSDPKAIYRILHGSSYLYRKPSNLRELVALVGDKGLAWADGELPLTSRAIQPLILRLGDIHKRQRRAMTPAFGLVEAKALFPCFARCSNSVSHVPAHP